MIKRRERERHTQNTKNKEFNSLTKDVPALDVCQFFYPHHVPTFY